MFRESFGKNQDMNGMYVYIYMIDIYIYYICIYLSIYN